MKTLAHLALLTALLVAAAAACVTGPGADAAYVEATLLTRYLAADGRVTAEASLSKRDSTRGLDSLYVSPGGVAFLGSDLKRASRSATAQRYRETVRAASAPDTRFALTNLAGERVTIAGTLRPFDTLIMGPLPTHNFGFTVYPADAADVLGAGEELTALFVPDEGQARTGTILGPSAPGEGYHFPRNSVADWPLGEGTLSFIRRRRTPIAAAGVRGELTEEVYTRPVRSAVVN